MTTVTLIEMNIGYYVSHKAITVSSTRASSYNHVKKETGFATAYDCEFPVTVLALTEDTPLSSNVPSEGGVVCGCSVR